MLQCSAAPADDSDAPAEQQHASIQQRFISLLFGLYDKVDAADVDVDDFNGGDDSLCPPSSDTEPDFDEVARGPDQESLTKAYAKLKRMGKWKKTHLLNSSSVVNPNASGTYVALAAIQHCVHCM